MSYTKEQLLTVLRAPCVTEKATMLADAHRQVVFKVARSATKPLVKQAVEALFKVEVEAVSVLNVKGKKTRHGQIEGRRNDWKKAYVTLKEGHDIDFTGSKLGEEK